MLPLEKVATPRAHTIELVAEYLRMPLAKNIKAVAFQTDSDQLVLAFVRGDHEVNEVKVLSQVEGAISLHMAAEGAIRDAGGEPGFMSPIGLKPGTTIIVDSTVMEMYNAVAGANEPDTHYQNVNPRRDFTNAGLITADIRLVKDGDTCPRCGAALKMTRGIEAGQVFALGTKYSEAMKATFLDENGKEKPLVMGCYGIGVSRTMAAAIEQSNDEHGIIWPAAIAPFEVAVVPVNARDEAQMELAEEVYGALQDTGLDVLLDDRKERAGVKFKDADLIGYPLRITIGPKTMESGQLEIRIRKTGEVIMAAKDAYLDRVQELLKSL